MGAVQIRLLGPVDVAVDGSSVRVGSAKERAVLALLALECGRVVAVERLVADLWPDTPPDRAGASLHVRMSNLRRVLRGAGADDLLVTRAPGYALVIDAGAVDALAFERELAAGTAALRDGRLHVASETLAEALARWRGDALADVRDVARLEGEATRLDDLRLLALEERIESDLGRGLDRELAGELDDLVQLHPFRERYWAQLVLALYRAGRQADALRAFQRLRSVLVEELGIEPGPALRDLEAAVLRQDASLDRTPPPAMPTSVSPPVDLDTGPFIGRQAELTRLRARLASAEARTQVAFVAGEPGIGKTSVLVELSRHARAGGALVLHGAADEEIGAPYQPFASALGDHVDLGGDVAPATVAERVADGLAALAKEQPVVVLLDDLQWADRTSLLLMRYLVRNRRPPGVFVVGAYRDAGLADDHPLAELLADLRGDPSCERLSLGGLDTDAVATMVEHGGSDASTMVADVLRSRTAGNPLFIGEILRHVAESGGQLDIPTVATIVPLGVTEVVGRRVRRLATMAQQALSNAAVLGAEFELAVVASMLAADPGAVIEALEESTSARLVIERPERRQPSYAFAHDVVRRALYEQLSSARRQQLHAAAVAAIESVHANELGEHLVALGRHYRDSGSAVDDDRAVEALDAAAEQLRAGWANEEAATLWTAALDRLGSDDRRRRGLVVRRSIALQASWHATFDVPSIAGVGGEDQPPAGKSAGERSPDSS